MVSKAWVTRLLAAALLLPAAILIVAALSRLLRAMGDASAGVVLDRLALAGGVVWILLLLGLVLVTALRQTTDAPDELDQ